MQQAIEIEVDGPHNEKMYFQPISRAIRGRFDFNRLNEPMARIRASAWPVPIPSQRLGIDPDGNGYIIEPLHDEEYAPIKEQIEKKLEMRLEPAITEFENVDLPTWLFWLNAIYETGMVKVTKGKLPAKVEGKPRLDFIVNREQSTEDKLTEALHAQTEAFNKLTDALLKVVGNK